MRQPILNTVIFTFKNYRAALVAALFFGCIAPGTKYLSQSIPPQSMAGILYFFAGLGLFAILMFRRELQISTKQFQKKDRKWFLVAITFGGILGPAFLTYGMMKISGATASLLLNLESVLTSLIAWFIFKEHFEKRIVWGMLFIVAGCIVLSLPSGVSSGQDTILGIFFISLACFSWGIDNNVTRNISHLNPIFIASTKGLIAGAANLFLGFAIGEKVSIDFHLFQAGILGFFGVGVSLVAFIISLGKIGTARTGALFSTAPFIGSILSIIILKESISIPFVTALLLMLFGMFFHFSEDHNHHHIHDVLEHNHVHTHDEHHQHTHNQYEPLKDQHTHIHRHEKISHNHSHFPDIHHQHVH